MTTTLKNDIEQQIAKAIRSNADSFSLYGRYQKGELLPKTLLDIPCLRHLCLTNFYTDMPAWLTNLTSLESLEIEEAGSVSEIVPLLWKLGRLRKLKLAYVDGLDEIFPLELTKLKHLEELNIDGAHFEHFPTEIASLTSLQSFSQHYCYCELPEIFDVLSALPRLKKLRLTHQPDEGGDILPESFCRLQSIEELHFNDWIYLQELPECIGSMRNLRVLDVSNDDHQHGYDALMNELPDSLCQISNLEELDVYGLQDLKQFPPNFSRLTRLKNLNTVGSGIDELHLTPEQWKNLEGLCMHGPLPDMRQCANLKDFYWFKNGVGVDASGVSFGTDEVISMPLSPLRKLESLKIMGGALDSTDFLASLTNLRKLHLSCDFEIFPAGFEKVNKLEKISIWGAKSLKALPEYLGHIPSLQSLYLTGCGVKELPKSIRERKDLYIDVCNCPVKWPE